MQFLPLISSTLPDSALNVPTGQFEHDDDPDSKYLPAAQLQAEAPGAEYLPTAQDVHVDAPCDECLPAAHDAHARVPSEYLPAAHE